MCRSEKGRRAVNHTGEEEEEITALNEEDGVNDEREKRERERKRVMTGEERGREEVVMGSEGLRERKREVAGE